MQKVLSTKVGQKSNKFNDIFINPSNKGVILLILIYFLFISMVCTGCKNDLPLEFDLYS